MWKDGVMFSWKQLFMKISSNIYVTYSKKNLLNVTTQFI